MSERVDVVVVGAGFGGLATGLRLAEEGARVVVCETLKYPGGCASTFEHRGYRFEAGATLFSGFGEGQLFRRWIDRHGLDVEIEWLDPVVELRTPSLALDIGPDRAAFLERLRALPGAPTDRLDRFFALQRRVADALWPLLDDPSLVPPFGVASLARHALRAPRYAPLLRWVGRPLTHVLARYELDAWQPLKTFLDALCQITVQCSSDEAEALFALSVMDYYFRGTGHVRHGIGRLAWQLVEAIRARGGEVRFTDRVRRLEPVGSPDRPRGWRVHTRRGVVETRAVAANVLPQTLGSMLDPESRGFARRSLEPMADRVATGWGACMLYRVVGDDAAVRDGGTVRDDPTGERSTKARHVEIVQDESRPFIAGNHLFCSLSGASDADRAPEGRRTLTVSTHVPMDELLAHTKAERGVYVEAIQERMRDGLARFAPEWAEIDTDDGPVGVRGTVDFATTASPRTFARFTGRHEGFVGGVPRRAGLHHYRPSALVPPPVRPGLYLVGDSVFPGQSTLATAVGGVKAAERILRRLSRRSLV